MTLTLDDLEPYRDAGLCGEGLDAARALLSDGPLNLREAAAAYIAAGRPWRDIPRVYGVLVRTGRLPDVGLVWRWAEIAYREQPERNAALRFWGVPGALGPETQREARGAAAAADAAAADAYAAAADAAAAAAAAWDAAYADAATWDAVVDAATWAAAYADAAAAAAYAAADAAAAYADADAAADDAAAADAAAATWDAVVVAAAAAWDAATWVRDEIVEMVVAEMERALGAAQ